ncbi:alpha/beta fold hydrolase [Actibacterium pelagium]|uniref:Hydrolase n=1 Tax=Actibacterium pelagium TaxID=2029103 RepID=A0A917AN13_9RHOB|nr:alpha/beta hydrolase [Actibacterium pelagium]GGE60908.1 hydrolase [Actibacterium pelagium]
MIHSFKADDGTKIAYRDPGKGKPLLCLAGLTRNMHDFDYLEPHLDGVRMICMDYRGRGLSEYSGPDTYTIAQEAQDAIALLDHLGLKSVPILGTSRGGLIGMALGATVPGRIKGLCMNDIGPVIEREGLEMIFEYVGRNPPAKTHEQMADLLAYTPGYDNVPHERWLEESEHHFKETEDGLVIRYDPALRDPFVADYDAELPDAWPMFDALDGMPVALIRGANSKLLSYETAVEMQNRRPDIIYANVPDRGHVPFLDEPESLSAVRAFLERCRPGKPG